MATTDDVPLVPLSLESKLQGAIKCCQSEFQQEHEGYTEETTTDIEWLISNGKWAIQELRNFWRCRGDNLNQSMYPRHLYERQLLVTIFPLTSAGDSELPSYKRLPPYAWVWS